MVDLGSGFDYLFAFAFALYFDFALEVDFFYALKVDFGFASRLVLGADDVANIFSSCCIDILP